MKFGMYVEVDECCVVVYHMSRTFRVRNSSIFNVCLCCYLQCELDNASK